MSSPQKSPTKGKTLLLDADSIVFGAGFATEKMRYKFTCWIEYENDSIYIEEEFLSKKDLDEWLMENSSLKDECFKVTKFRVAEPVENALYLAGRTVRNLMEKLHSDKVEVYLTGTDNFRYDVATIQPYKGNRANAERPTHEKAIRDYLIERWNAIVIDGQEADDAVSIRQMQLWPDSVIVSADKDLDMVPGWHSKVYDPEAYFITWEKGMYNFYKQLLMGDSTDHIRGVPGIGAKKAEAILEGLETEPEMYRATYDTYLAYHVHCLEKEGLEVEEDVVFQKVEDDVIENGRLLWMRTYEGEMWQPPEMESDDGSEEADE